MRLRLVNLTLVSSTSRVGRMERLQRTPTPSFPIWPGFWSYAGEQISFFIVVERDRQMGRPTVIDPWEVVNALLSYFRASPDEYEAIFTLNASGALKLVGESYPFGPGAQYRHLLPKAAL